MKYIALIIALSFSIITMADNLKPPFFVYSAMGQVDGWTTQRKFGFNNDVDTTSTPEDVWALGGTYSFPVSATPTTIVSSSTSDDVGSTGCTTVVVSGLDENYTEISSTALMNGTSEVTLSNEFFRVNRAICVSSGSSHGNVGNISVKHGSTTIGYMPIGRSITQQVVYTTPANKKWSIDTLTAALGRKGTGTADIDFEVMQFGTNTWVTILRFQLASTGSSILALSPANSRPFVVPARSDIRLRVASVDANDTSISVNVAGSLVDNDGLSSL